MGETKEDLIRIEKKLDLLLSFFALSIDPKASPRNVLDLKRESDRLFKKIQERRNKGGVRA